MTYINIDTLSAQIKTMSEIVTKENNPVLQYDSTSLKKALQNMYVLISYNIIDLNLYPNLLERINAGQINDTEFSGFLYSYKKDINIVNSIFLDEITRINNNTFKRNNYIIPFNLNTFFVHYNAYYSDNDYGEIAGDFCSVYNKISPLLAITPTLLSEINNLSNNNLFSDLMSINNIVDKMIDKILNKMQQKISSLIESTSSISNNTIFNSIYKKIKSIESLFTDENKDKIKESFETSLMNIINQFKSIDADTIQFVLHQACKATGGLQSLLIAPLLNVENNINSYNNALNILTNTSNQNTLMAVEAGAIRLNQSAISSGKYNFSSNLNSNYSSSDIVPTHYITMEVDDFERSLVATLNENGNQFISFSENVLRMEKDFPSSNPANNIPGAGWRKVHPEAYIKLFRVAKRMGKKFLITSGYRNENKNASLSGAAKHSLHMSGLALDVNMSGVDVSTFIKYSSQEGFGGIGTYSSFVHVDLGNRRSWGGYHNDLLNIHNSDRFRRG